MRTSKIHRATVTGADLHHLDTGSDTGSDPVETHPGTGLVRGDLHGFAPSGLAAGR